MGANLKDLRRKIKSITGTKKITQAMQMVAASKMQKAINSAEKSRSYSRLAWDIITNIGSGTTESHHPLLIKRKKKNIAIILVTSNRGLCGGLNAQILRKLNIFIKEKQEKGFIVKLFTIGNKGKQFVSRFYKDLLVADFPLPEGVIEYSDITALGKMIIDEYCSENFDRVFVFYNHFKTTLTQEAQSRQILPIPDMTEVEEYQIGKTNANSSHSELAKNLNNTRSFTAVQDDNQKPIPSVNRLSSTEYKFEPDIKSILNTILPKVIMTQIYQMFLEANASEQAARMIAMKNATDNAGEIIGDLTLTYNSARQAAITQELTEITAGSEALRA
ncbi:MAG: ATP synthase F1, gamma subunit [uncultured bacterium]|nr:MAG: ATP synthase F1, gamma subunit [uncultured bacterium]